MKDNRELFEELCRRLGVEPDRRGEAHIPCPACGKEVKRGHVHFSFSERGGACMVCGYRAGLVQLARVLGAETRPWQPPPPKRRPKREAPRPWDFEALAASYEAHPDRVRLWQSYKPLSVETIRRYRLGVGPLPLYSSRCGHERLQVPLIDDGRVVGFRSRQLGCACAGKWLSPTGTRLVLYNAHVLEGRYGVRICILENPIDALLAQERAPGIVFLATLGVSMWRPEWTERLRAARPVSVVVGYDNDRPGNGGGARGREAWLETHARDIVPGGVRLCNILNEAGVRARLLRWPASAPLKADFGLALAGGGL